MSKRAAPKGKVSVPSGSKSASSQTEGPAPWNSFLSAAGPLNSLKSQLRTTITKDITTYMSNPASHPDITSSQVSVKSSTQTPKGTTAVTTTTHQRLQHKDGFEKAPLFQSNLVTVQTEMETRIGGRGLVALADIQPGTLLLCEYIRHPFQQGLKADDGTPIRPEVEFIQEFCFDMTNTQRVELLVDLGPLFPFKSEEIEPDHREFLLFVYGDLLAECSKHLLASQKNIITVPTSITSLPPLIEINESLLLRLICVIHFNSFPSGMLLHTSMVNHNCQPNAVKLFIPRQEIVRNSKEFTKTSKTQINPALYQPKTLSQRVYSELRSTTFIKQGEEIFISYIPSHLTDLTVNQRQTYLHRQFRFNCDCMLCGFEKGQLSLSTPSSLSTSPLLPGNGDSNGAHGNNNSGELVVDGDQKQQEIETMLQSLSFSSPDDCTKYEFDSHSSLSTKTAWIDELTRNYINFTSGQGHESVEQQHEAYLKATKQAKDRHLVDQNDFASTSASPNDQTDTKTHSNDHNNNNGDSDDDNDPNVEANDEALMSFRELYGLPTTVNVQVFILLQSISVLYPYLFPVDNTGINIYSLDHVELQQLLTKCHKLVLLVSKDLLQHIQQDLSIETISLILYMYMLFQPQITPLSPLLSSHQSPQRLLPWAGSIQLASVLTDLDSKLVENATDGYETTTTSCNNTETRYVIGIVSHSEEKESQLKIDGQGGDVADGSAADNWTIDSFLLKTFLNLSTLIDPASIITSNPILVNINMLPPVIKDNFNLVESRPAEDENGSTGVLAMASRSKIHVRLAQLLLIMKPISQLLISQYTDRVVSSIHLTVSTIGLVSSLFNAQYHLRQHQFINNLKEQQQQQQQRPGVSSSSSAAEVPVIAAVTTNNKDLFHLQISTTYNDILFNILYYLQNFLPHHAFASKILRMALFKDLIGKSPADATRFAESLEHIHFKICDLYNMCPIETIAKGI